MFDINWHIYVFGSIFFNGHLKYREGHKLNKRTVLNYELEYITKGGAGMYINDVFYKVNTGDVIFRKPGDTTRGIMPYTCIYIVFGTTRETYERRDNYENNSLVLAEKSINNPILDTFEPLISTKEESDIISGFEKLYKSFFVEEDIGDYRRRILLEQLIIKIYDLTLEKKTKDKKSNPYQSKLERVKQYVKNHLDEKIYLEDLANKAQLSTFHFNRIFKQYEGCTPMEYITTMRMYKSKELLLSSEHSITEIALLCGFESSSYYSYVFKKCEGKTPREYRKLFSYDS